MSSEYDVVIAGSGAGGLAAALAAAELGLSPIVLEKAEKLGGMSAQSWGLVWVGSNHLAAEAGIEDPPEDVEAYARFIGAGSQSDERQQAFIRTAPEMVRFFERAGIRFRLNRGLTDHYYDFAPGSTATGRELEVEPVSGHDLGEWQDRTVVPSPAPYRVTAQELISWGGPKNVGAWDQHLMEERRRDDLRGLGAGLVAAFVKALLARGVDLRVNAAVAELVAEEGRIVGVRLADGSEIRARKGVVLASGSHEASPELLKRFGGVLGQLTPATTANKAATGDAFVMASEQGAALQFKTNRSGPLLGFELPAEPHDGLSAFKWWGASLSELQSPHTMLVNRRGSRFGNEAHFQFLAPKLQEFDPFTREYVNLPAYIVFDRQYTDRFGFVGAPQGEPIPDWVSRADTIGELASLLGIDPGGLEASVERFNRFARAGRDEDFGRGTELWRLAQADSAAPSRLGTVEVPPFYGVQVQPTSATNVGLLADSHARVLHVRGQPIPGLFAVGFAASFDEIGVGYQAGMMLASCLTFGYIAAREMADAVHAETSDAGPVAVGDGRSG